MLNKEQIMEILPHRPPMLLVDEILEMDEEHAVGTLHLTGDEFFFQGHFPGNPIMPAVFRLEALAQVGGVALLSIPEFKGKTAVYTGIDKAKFRAMAKPGDTLRLEVRFVKRRGPMAVAEGVAWVGDQKAAEAEIKCMVIMGLRQGKQCFKRYSSRTAARSRSASYRLAATWASFRSRYIPRPTARHCTRRSRMKRCASGRRALRKAI